MKLLDRATIMHYHRHRIATFGEGSVEALGWKEEASQLRRFEVIADAVQLSEDSCLLDVGCGHGDLLGFLDGRATGFSYVGIDQMPEFVERARRAYDARPRTSFYEGDFMSMPLPAADFVVACGSLNYRSEDPAFHLSAIRRMWGVTRQAMVFNVLDASLFPDHPLLVGRDTEEVLAVCSELSPSVRMIDGTPDDDLTVCVSRVDQG